MEENKKDEKSRSGKGMSRKALKKLKELKNTAAQGKTVGGAGRHTDGFGNCSTMCPTRYLCH